MTPSEFVSLDQAAYIAILLKAHNKVSLTYLLPKQLHSLLQKRTKRFSISMCHVTPIVLSIYTVIGANILCTSHFVISCRELKEVLFLQKYLQLYKSSSLLMTKRHKFRMHSKLCTVHTADSITLSQSVNRVARVARVARVVRVVSASAS